MVSSLQHSATESCCVLSLSWHNRTERGSGSTAAAAATAAVHSSAVGVAILCLCGTPPRVRCVGGISLRAPWRLRSPA